MGEHDYNVARKESGSLEKTPSTEEPSSANESSQIKEQKKVDSIGWKALNTLKNKFESFKQSKFTKNFKAKLAVIFPRNLLKRIRNIKIRNKQKLELKDMAQGYRPEGGGNFQRVQSTVQPKKEAHAPKPGTVHDENAAQAPENVSDEKAAHVSEQVFVAPQASKIPPLLKEKIGDEVNRFLHPYFTGQITPQNDDKNRGALVDHIIKKLKDDPKFAGIENLRSEIEEIALDAYFQETARVVLMAGGFHNRKEEAKMAEGLGSALKIDFPQIKLSKPQISEKLRISIDDYKKKSTATQIKDIDAKEPAVRDLEKFLRKGRVADLLGKQIALTEEQHEALDVERSLYDEEWLVNKGGTEWTFNVPLESGVTELSLLAEESDKFQVRGLGGVTGKFHIVFKEGENEFISNEALSLSQIRSTELFRAALPEGWQEHPQNALLLHVGVQLFQNSSGDVYQFNDLGKLISVEPQKVQEFIEESQKLIKESQSE